MPSHIFVQLGMWQEAGDSNIVAYKAAVDLNAQLKLAEGREDFHTLSWLALRQPDARQVRRGEEERRVGEGRPRIAIPATAAFATAISACARGYIQDTGQWEKLTLPAAAPAAAGDHANMPGMPAWARYDGSATWIYIVGVSAAKLGDLATAEAAEAALKARDGRVKDGTNAYAAQAARRSREGARRHHPLGQGPEGRGAAAAPRGRRRRADD